MKETNIFTNTLKQYIVEANISSNTLYLFLGLVGLLSVFILVYSYVLRYLNTPKVILIFSSVLATITVCLFFVGLTVYLVYGSQPLILKYNLRLTFLIILLCLFVLLILLFNNFIKAVKKGSLSVYCVQYGPISLRNRKASLVRHFKLFRYYIWITFIPYVLIFLFDKKVNTYSIIFDNSGSMSEQIESAYTTLNEISSGLPEETKIVFTTFPICTNPESDCLDYYRREKLNIDAIVRTNNPQELIPESFTFKNKQDFQIFLSNTTIRPTAVGSPIYEAIWQNYLLTKEINKADVKSKLIIVTDGEDNLHSKDPKVTVPRKSILDYKHEGFSMSEYYSVISLVKYEGLGENTILDICDNIVELDGYSNVSMKKSIYNQFLDTYTDLTFIIIFFCIHLLLTTSLFLLKI